MCRPNSPRSDCHWRSSVIRDFLSFFHTKTQEYYMYHLTVVFPSSHKYQALLLVMGLLLLNKQTSDYI